MQDWLATVDWLQDKLDAPSLTIRLVGEDVICFTPGVYKTTITISDGDVSTRSYQEFWRSLKPLADNGLARFYAHFPCSWLLRGTAELPHEVGLARSPEAELRSLPNVW